MKIPWRRKWQPTPVFLPQKSHGQRSLVGYSRWGHKESDMTEHTCMVILILAHPTPGAAPTSSIVRESLLPTLYQRPLHNQSDSLGKQGVPKNCSPPRTACLLKAVCLMRTPGPPPRKSSYMAPNPQKWARYPQGAPGLNRVLFTSPVIRGEGW